MLGTFTFHNPTKLYFGEDALEGLREELPKYGKTVQLIYGGGSVKRNGIYEAVMKILLDCGKTVVEDGGVMPNPTVDKLKEGVRIARENKVDLLLAVGGGSCCDYAKAVSVSVHEPEDPWEKYFARYEDPTCAIVPVGCVLTMAGTGSEMNGGSVITNPAEKMKIGKVFDERVNPRFSILNPKFTYSLPMRQTVAGVFDIFSHICEQYFSGLDDNVSDAIAEALMRAVVRASRVVILRPDDYEARSNIMWAATWALNNLIGCGKTEDWMVHMLGQAIGAYTDATHGFTLAAVSLPYYRHVMPYGLPKFVRFAGEVWDVDPKGKTKGEIAEEGLKAMHDWMKEIGVAVSLRDLGVTEDMIEGIADATILMDGTGYHTLTRDEVVTILNESF